VSLQLGRRRRFCGKTRTGRLRILLSKSMSGVPAFQRDDVRFLFIFRERVQLGLKNISCSVYGRSVHNSKIQ
jgi:hypothetical protein